MAKIIIINACIIVFKIYHLKERDPFLLPFITQTFININLNILDYMYFLADE